MKVLCSISGIEFNCEHFPAYLSSRELTHPIFHLPQKKLLSYTGKWAAGELTPTDSYLLFLATLNSTELIEWRMAATRTADTNSLVAQNMESLVKIVSRISSITNPAVCFPHYAIGPETKTLSNIHHWIENWQEAYQDFQDGYAREYESRKLITREAALERMIKNPHLPISAYASKIAEWASIAGDFPDGYTPSPFSRETIKLSEYWKEIIIRCSKEEQLFAVPYNDIAELLEHCELNISIGTIYSNALFKVLRHAMHRQKNFLGIGEMDLSRSKYQILGPSDTVETANIKAMIDAAPEVEPVQSNYPNKLAYLKAKMRWSISRRYGSGVGDNIND